MGLWDLETNKFCSNRGYQFTLDLDYETKTNKGKFVKFKNKFYEIGVWADDD